MERKWCLTDLITNPATGKLSQTRVWANVAYTAATFVIVKTAIMGNLQSDLLFVYLLATTVHGGLSKYLALKRDKEIK